nr:aldolase [Chryseobacterium sp.]
MMKVKILKIRLSEEFQNHDEQQLNRFLRQHEVIKITSSMINGSENFWSVIIYYDEGYPTVHEKKNKYTADTELPLNSDEVKILDSLRLWR